jgi:hypothetical protein
MNKVKIHIDPQPLSEKEVSERKNFKRVKARFDAHYRYKSFYGRFYKDYKYRVIVILLLILLIYWISNE